MPYVRLAYKKSAQQILNGGLGDARGFAPLCVPPCTRQGCILQGVTVGQIFLRRCHLRLPGSPPRHGHFRACPKDSRVLASPGRAGPRTHTKSRACTACFIRTAPQSAPDPKPSVHGNCTPRSYPACLRFCPEFSIILNRSRVGRQPHRGPFPHTWPESSVFLRVRSAPFQTATSAHVEGAQRRTPRRGKRRARGTQKR